MASRVSGIVNIFCIFSEYRSICRESRDMESRSPKPFSVFASSLSWWGPDGRRPDSDLRTSQVEQSGLRASYLDLAVISHAVIRKSRKGLNGPQGFAEPGLEHHSKNRTSDGSIDYITEMVINGKRNTLASFFRQSSKQNTLRVTAPKHREFSSLNFTRNLSSRVAIQLEN